MDFPKVVFVIGPTGVGKSKLGIEIAKRFDGEVISMDSMQVYKSLDILTNKVTDEETEGIPHHMLSIVDPEQQFDVTQFVTKCDKLVHEIHARGKLPIIVGGTCYYCYSLMIRNKGVGVETNNAPNIENKREIEKCLSSGENMDKILEKIDPVAYKITKHNPNKWRTYLMSYLRTGSTISELNQSISVCYSNALIFWITSDMKILFNRIDNRADDMVTKGLIDELKNFITNHKNVDFTKSQFASIGLKQLLPLAENTCSSDVRNQCIEDLKSVTKKYAVNQQKFITSKLCSKDRIPGLPPIYQLNASDIENWNIEVRDTAMNAVETYLKDGNESLEKIEKLVKISEEESAATANEYYTKQLEKTEVLECEDCNIKIISSQLDIHLKSKRHKKRLAGIRKREKNLKRLKTVE